MMPPDSEPIEPAVSATSAERPVAASGFPWDELVQERIRALEEDRAARLRNLLELQAVNASLERDRADRLRVIEELTARVHELEREAAMPDRSREAIVRELLEYRREALLPVWKRVYRRLTGKLPQPAPLPVVEPSPPSSPAAPVEVPETTTFRSMSTDRALWRIRRRGLDVATVIDVGASNGMWSAVCERHLPEAHYLLVEAQACHEEALIEYCARRPRARYVLAAAGPDDGELWFDEGDPFSGLASTTQRPGMRRRLPAIALDREVERRGLPGPFLVKLDVHGFEVPILEGASDILASAALVVIECYVFRLLESSLLFDEMVRWMRERGFGVIDASEPLWRDKDAALWQFDLFFVPLSRSEFSSNTWS